MKIAVIGTGYVGLVTGTCFAETGNQVICVDVNEEKIEALKKGITPIYEPGLEVLLTRNIREERISFTNDLEAAVQDALVIFLALPTPSGEDGSADLKYVLQVAAQLGDLITSYRVVVNKSTVPVGTAEKVAAILSEKLPAELFDVVSNPEFLREGVAVDDFLKPERVVVGAGSERAAKIMEELYNPFVRQGNPVYFMDTRSAEMTKYAANSFLAMKISFMNEIANLCERTGANVDWVRIGIGSDQRIGKRFLFPGIGYGGSCFPKDVLALNLTAKEHAYDFKLLQSVLEVNRLQKGRIIEKLRAYFRNELNGKLLAVWGLAFKPETDDIRDAPSIDIIEALLAEGATVKVYDPVAMDNIHRKFGDQLGYSANQYEALQDADALLILTEWSEFRNPDFEKMKMQLKTPVVFDGRNVYALEKMKEQGFYYESMGRNTVPF
ncbi:UDP-glucose dehydrogenase family protein [Niabella drilacis]|uniref:UDP-glucose 6-dehydrogenase n=1 Tax=Niabella drilacis (strain DSM 25811 / CCM 8410 / CCUG 62505 / LMG 26954 / E90) TaxID=1285928 RepID=A0A1G6IEU8_NIADE|nr:UDP-glucose/GDP-mannose dehydrogenase family protein [Niabella drilacis]SDC04994.1 UDP-glucose dehydrogenase [Niabella drilacis]